MGDPWHVTRGPEAKLEFVFTIPEGGEQVRVWVGNKVWVSLFQEGVTPLSTTPCPLLVSNSDLTLTLSAKINEKRKKTEKKSKNTAETSHQLAFEKVTPHVK